MWGGKHSAYIGIEAGSKVGACQKNEWVSMTQRRTQRRGIELNGLDSELTFADLVCRLVVSASNARPRLRRWSIFQADDA